MKRIFLVSIVLITFQNIFCQEKQIPFFPEAGINTINKSYAKKSVLFADYSAFLEAQLYEISENEYAVEIYFEKNDTIYKERKLLDSLQKQVFIDDLMQQMVASGKATKKKSREISAIASDSSRHVSQISRETMVLSQKGRTGLLISSSIVGLGFYGYAVPITFGIDGDKEFIASYMLVGASGFLIPYYATRYKNVTVPQLSMTLFGQTRGIANGFILGELIHNAPDFNEESGNWEEYLKLQDKHERLTIGLGILGSLTEGFAGFKLASKWNYSIGSASIHQMWGDVGLLSGILFADVFKLTGSNLRSDEQMKFGTWFTSSMGGLVAGRFFADSRNYTLGDAIFYRSTIALAASLPVVFVHYFDPNGTQPYSASILLGGLTGSYLGWKALQGRDFTTAQGFIISLGMISGGLIGLGTGALIADDFNADVLLTTTAIGAITGYGLFYYAFKNKALTLGKNVKLEMNINPAAFITNNHDDKSYSTNPACNNYLFNFRATF